MIDSDIQDLLNDKGWKRGWKAVKTAPIHGMAHYYSSCVHFLDCGVEYFIHAITVPHAKMGPLAVFPESAMEASRAFAKDTWYKIHPCIYKPSKEACLWDNDVQWDLDRCPVGTALADAVMLLPQRLSRKE